jgi:hypothetical protein
MRSLGRLLAGSRARSNPEQPAAAPAAAETNGGPIDGIPPWAVSSVMAFLGPFVSNQGLEARSYYGASHGDAGRDFLLEVERNVRIPLDWRHGRPSADRSLAVIIHKDNDKFVQVLDYAIRNIRLGYDAFEIEQAAQALDRVLTEGGSVWAVAGDPRQGYRLRRRVTEAGDDLAHQLQSGTGDAASELRTAYDKAYGRDPEPGAAYRHAVMAVEAAAIPVVSPNNSTATLGTVISDIRNKPANFSAVFTRDARRVGPSGDDLSPVEVVLAQLDLLWANHTDRHPPLTAITQEQAEWAVHMAALLVQMFRVDWVR